MNKLNNTKCTSYSLNIIPTNLRDYKDFRLFIEKDIQANEFFAVIKYGKNNTFNKTPIIISDKKLDSLKNKISIFFKKNEISNWKLESFPNLSATPDNKPKNEFIEFIHNDFNQTYIKIEKNNNKYTIFVINHANNYKKKFTVEHNLNLRFIFIEIIKDKQLNFNINNFKIDTNFNDKNRISETIKNIFKFVATSSEPKFNNKNKKIKLPYTEEIVENIERTFSEQENKIYRNIFIQQQFNKVPQNQLKDRKIKLFIETCENKWCNYNIR
jgi:hypothetical protein